jgi:acetyl-CoA synthetase
MGMHITILNEQHQKTTEGEVAIIPPSIGLSTTLINADHHDIYFANMPTGSDGKTLRRHGDLIKKLENGYYMLLGRADDAMNLGGIKVSAAEIERVLNNIPAILEVAAIAVAPNNQSLSQLIIYAVTTHPIDTQSAQKIMQEKINQHLNPLFKIHEVIFIPTLPKTISNKIMRKTLRKQYELKK